MKSSDRRYEVLDGLRGIAAITRGNVMRKNNLSTIQALRGIAALLVVMFHAIIAARDYHWAVGALEWIGPYGQIGVDIFFVISGFVMVLSTFDEPSSLSTSRSFMVARVLRIAPLYWTLTAVMATLLVLMPNAFNNQRFTTMRAVTSLLFIPYREPGALHTYPIVYVGWTLSYEFLFYAVFAIVLLLKRKFFIPAIVAIFGGLISMSMLHKPQSFLFGFLTDPIMLEFVLGCLVGWAFVHNARVGRRLAIFLLLAATGFFLWTLPRGLVLSQRWIWWGVPAALLVASAVFFESGRSATRTLGLAAVGNASYSIYLAQTFMLPVLARLLRGVDRTNGCPGSLVCLALIVGSCAGGYAVYLCIERPIGRFISSSRKARMTELRLKENRSAQVF